MANHHSTIVFDGPMNIDAQVKSSDQSRISVGDVVVISQPSSGSNEIVYVACSGVLELCGTFGVCIAADIASYGDYGTIRTAGRAKVKAVGPISPGMLLKRSTSVIGAAEEATAATDGNIFARAMGSVASGSVALVEACILSWRA